VANTLRRWRSANPCLVDDLVQNVYLKLCANDFKALRDLHCPNEAALFGFLRVVASHVAHDHFRSSCCKKRGSGKTEADLENLKPTREQIHNFAWAVEQRILIHQIKQCLQSRKRDARFIRDYKIFWLHYGHGLTAREISEHLKINIGAKGVESILQRMTRMVRMKMNAMPCREGQRVN
jgi:RNA polymerase sigma-70 factor (ECF subfamily)